LKEGDQKWTEEGIEVRTELREGEQDLLNAARKMFEVHLKTSTEANKKGKPKTPYGEQIEASTLALAEHIGNYSNKKVSSGKPGSAVDDPLLISLPCGKGKTIPIACIQVGFMEYVALTAPEKLGSLRLFVIADTVANVDKDWGRAGEKSRGTVEQYLKDVIAKGERSGAKDAEKTAARGARQLSVVMVTSAKDLDEKKGGLYAVDARTVQSIYHSSATRGKLKGFDMMTIDEAEAVFGQVRLTMGMQTDVLSKMNKAERRSHKATYDITNKLRKLIQKRFDKEQERQEANPEDVENSICGENSAFGMRDGELIARESFARDSINRTLNSSARDVEILGGRRNAELILTNYCNRTVEILTRGNGIERIGTGKYKGYMMLGRDGSVMKNTKFGDAAKSLAAAQKYGANFSQAINEMYSSSSGGVSIFEALNYINANSKSGRRIMVCFAGTTLAMRGVAERMGFQHRNIGESEYEQVMGERIICNGDGMVRNARAWRDTLRLRAKGVEKQEGVEGQNVEDLLMVQGNLDYETTKKTANKIAEVHVPEGGKVVRRTYRNSKGEITEYTAVDSKGKELCSAPAYETPGVMIEAGCRAVRADGKSLLNPRTWFRKAGNQNQEAFGKKIHVIAQLVTGANIGSISDGKLTFDSPTNLKSIFTDVIYKRYGVSDSCSETQAGERFNVEGNRAPTVKLVSANGKITAERSTKGNRHSEHYMDVDSFEGSARQIEDMRSSVVKGDRAAAARQADEMMGEATKRIDRNQAIEYESVTAKEVEEKMATGRDFNFDVEVDVDRLSSVEVRTKYTNLVESDAWARQDGDRVCALAGAMEGLESAEQTELLAVFNKDISMNDFGMLAGLYGTLGNNRSDVSVPSLRQSLESGFSGTLAMLAENTDNEDMATRLTDLRESASLGFDMSHVDDMADILGIAVDAASVVDELQPLILTQEGGEYKVNVSEQLVRDIETNLREGNLPNMQRRAHLARRMGVSPSVIARGHADVVQQAVDTAVRNYMLLTGQAPEEYHVTPGVVSPEQMPGVYDAGIGITPPAVTPLSPGASVDVTDPNFTVATAAAPSYEDITTTPDATATPVETPAVADRGQKFSVSVSKSGDPVISLAPTEVSVVEGQVTPIDAEGVTVSHQGDLQTVMAQPHVTETRDVVSQTIDPASVAEKTDAGFTVAERDLLDREMNVTATGVGSQAIDPASVVGESDAGLTVAGRDLSGGGVNITARGVEGQRVDSASVVVEEDDAGIMVADSGLTDRQLQRSVAADDMTLGVQQQFQDRLGLEAGNDEFDRLQDHATPDTAWWGGLPAVEAEDALMREAEDAEPLSLVFAPQRVGAHEVAALQPSVVGVGAELQQDLSQERVSATPFGTTVQVDRTGVDHLEASPSDVAITPGEVEVYTPQAPQVEAPSDIEAQYSVDITADVDTSAAGLRDMLSVDTIDAASEATAQADLGHMDATLVSAPEFEMEAGADLQGEIRPGVQEATQARGFVADIGSAASMATMANAPVRHQIPQGARLSIDDASQVEVKGVDPVRGEVEVELKNARLTVDNRGTQRVSVARARIRIEGTDVIFRNAGNVEGNIESFEFDATEHVELINEVLNTQLNDAEVDMCFANDPVIELDGKKQVVTRLKYTHRADAPAEMTVNVDSDMTVSIDSMRYMGRTAEGNRVVAVDEVVAANRDEYNTEGAEYRTIPRRIILDSENRVLRNDAGLSDVEEIVAPSATRQLQAERFAGNSAFNYLMLAAMQTVNGRVAVEDFQRLGNQVAEAVRDIDAASENMDEGHGTELEAAVRQFVGGIAQFGVSRGTRDELSGIFDEFNQNAFVRNGVFERFTVDEADSGEFTLGATTYSVGQVVADRLEQAVRHKNEKTPEGDLTTRAKLSRFTIGATRESLASDLSRLAFDGGIENISGTYIAPEEALSSVMDELVSVETTAAASHADNYSRTDTARRVDVGTPLVVGQEYGRRAAETVDQVRDEAVTLLTGIREGGVLQTVAVLDSALSFEENRSDLTLYGSQATRYIATRAMMRAAEVDTIDALTDAITDESGLVSDEKTRAIAERAEALVRAAIRPEAERLSEADSMTQDELVRATVETLDRDTEVTAESRMDVAGLDIGMETTTLDDATVTDLGIHEEAVTETQTYATQDEEFTTGTITTEDAETYQEVSTGTVTTSAETSPETETTTGVEEDVTAQAQAQEEVDREESARQDSIEMAQEAEGVAVSDSGEVIVASRSVDGIDLYSETTQAESSETDVTTESQVGLETPQDATADMSFELGVAAQPVTLARVESVIAVTKPIESQQLRKDLDQKGVLREALRLYLELGDRDGAAALIGKEAERLIEGRRKAVEEGGEPMAREEADNIALDLFAAHMWLKLAGEKRDELKRERKKNKEDTKVTPEEVAKKITPVEELDLRPEQHALLDAFKKGFLGCGSTSMGKTYVNIMEAMIAHILYGDSVNALLLVEKAAAIPTYDAENDGTLVECLGMKIVNGDALYEKGKQEGNFDKLAKALQDPKQIVMMTYQQGTFMCGTAYKREGRAIRKAMRKVNLIRIDEQDKFAFSTDMCIEAGQGVPVSEWDVRQMKRLRGKILDMTEADTPEMVQLTENELTELVDAERKAKKEAEKDSTDDRAPPKGKMAFAVSEDGQKVSLSDAATEYLTAEFLKEKAEDEEEASHYTIGEVQSLMRAMHHTQKDKGDRRLFEGASGGYKFVEVDGETKVCPVGEGEGAKQTSTFQDHNYAIGLALGHDYSVEEVQQVVEISETTTGSVYLELAGLNKFGDVAGASGTQFPELLKAMLGKDTYVVEASIMDLASVSCITEGDELNDESYDKNDDAMTKARKMASAKREAMRAACKKAEDELEALEDKIESEFREATEEETARKKELKREIDKKRKEVLVVRTNMAADSDADQDHEFSEDFINQLIENVVAGINDRCEDGNGASQLIYLESPALNAIVAERLQAMYPDIVDEIDCVSTEEELVEKAAGIREGGTPRIMVTNDSGLIGTNFVGVEVDSHIVASKMHKNLFLQAQGRTARKEGNRSVVTIYMDPEVIDADLAKLRQFNAELRTAWTPKLTIDGEKCTVTSARVLTQDGSVRGEKIAITMETEDGQTVERVVNTQYNAIYDTVDECLADTEMKGTRYTAFGDVGAFALLDEYMEDTENPFSSRTKQDQLKLETMLKLEYRTACAKDASVAHAVSEALDGDCRMFAKQLTADGDELDELEITENAGDVAAGLQKKLFAKDHGTGDISINDEYLSGQDRLAQVVAAKKESFIKWLKEASEELDKLGENAKPLKARVDAKLAEVEGTDVNAIEADSTKDWIHSTTFGEKVAVAKTLGDLMLPSRASRDQAKQIAAQKMMSSASQTASEAEEMVKTEEGETVSGRTMMQAARKMDEAVAQSREVGDANQMGGMMVSHYEQKAVQMRFQAAQQRRQEAQECLNGGAGDDGRAGPRAQPTAIALQDAANAFEEAAEFAQEAKAMEDAIEQQREEAKKKQEAEKAEDEAKEKAAGEPDADTETEGPQVALATDEDAKAVDADVAEATGDTVVDAVTTEETTPEAAETTSDEADAVTAQAADDEVKEPTAEEKAEAEAKEKAEKAKREEQVNGFISECQEASASLQRQADTQRHLDRYAAWDGQARQAIEAAHTAHAEGNIEEENAAYDRAEQAFRNAHREFSRATRIGTSMLTAKEGDKEGQERVERNKNTLASFDRNITLLRAEQALRPSLDTGEEWLAEAKNILLERDDESGEFRLEEGEDGKPAHMVHRSGLTPNDINDAAVAYDEAAVAFQMASDIKAQFTGETETDLSKKAQEFRMSAENYRARATEITTHEETDVYMAMANTEAAHQAIDKAQKAEEAGDLQAAEDYCIQAADAFQNAVDAFDAATENEPTLPEEEAKEGVTNKDVVDGWRQEAVRLRGVAGNIRLRREHPDLKKNLDLLNEEAPNVARPFLQCASSGVVGEELLTGLEELSPDQKQEFAFALDTISGLNGIEALDTVNNAAQGIRAPKVRALVYGRDETSGEDGDVAVQGSSFMFVSDKTVTFEPTRDGTITVKRDGDAIFSINREGQISMGDYSSLPPVGFENTDEHVAAVVQEDSGDITVVSTAGNRIKITADGKTQVFGRSDEPLVTVKLGTRGHKDDYCVFEGKGNQRYQQPLEVLGMQGTIGTLNVGSVSDNVVFRTRAKTEGGLIETDLAVYHKVTNGAAIAKASLSGEGELIVINTSEMGGRSLDEFTHVIHGVESLDDVSANSNGMFAVKQGEQVEVFDINKKRDNQPFTLDIETDTDAECSVTPGNKVVIAKADETLAVIDPASGDVTLNDETAGNSISLRAPKDSKFTVSVRQPKRGEETEDGKPVNEALLGTISVDTIDAAGPVVIAQANATENTLTVFDRQSENSETIDLAVSQTGNETLNQRYEIDILEVQKDGTVVVTAQNRDQERTIETVVEASQGRSSILDRVLEDEALQIAVEKAEEDRQEAIASYEAGEELIGMAPDYTGTPQEIIVTTDNAILAEAVENVRKADELLEAASARFELAQEDTNKASSDLKKANARVRRLERDILKLRSDNGAPARMRSKREKLEDVQVSIPELEGLRDQTRERSRALENELKARRENVDSARGVLAGLEPVTGSTADTLSVTTLDFEKTQADKLSDMRWRLEAAQDENLRENLDLAGIDRGFLFAIRNGILDIADEMEMEGGERTEDILLAGERLLKLQNIQNIVNCASGSLFIAFGARGIIETTVDDPEGHAGKLMLARQLAMVVIEDCLGNPDRMAEVMSEKDQNTIAVSFNDMQNVASMHEDPVTGERASLRTCLVPTSELVRLGASGSVAILSVAQGESDTNNHHVALTGVSEDEDTLEVNDYGFKYPSLGKLRERNKFTEEGDMFPVLVFNTEAREEFVEEGISEDVRGSEGIPAFADSSVPEGSIAGADLSGIGLQRTDTEFIAIEKPEIQITDEEVDTVVLSDEDTAVVEEDDSEAIALAESLSKPTREPTGKELSRAQKIRDRIDLLDGVLGDTLESDPTWSEYTLAQAEAREKEYDNALTNARRDGKVSSIHIASLEEDKTRMERVVWGKRLEALKLSLAATEEGAIVIGKDENGFEVTSVRCNDLLSPTDFTYTCEAAPFELMLDLENEIETDELLDPDELRALEEETGLFDEMADAGTEAEATDKVDQNEALAASLEETATNIERTAEELFDRETDELQYETANILGRRDEAIQRVDSQLESKLAAVDDKLEHRLAELAAEERAEIYKAEGKFDIGQSALDYAVNFARAPQTEHTVPSYMTGMYDEETVDKKFVKDTRDLHITGIPKHDGIHVCSTVAARARTVWDNVRHQRKALSRSYEYSNIIYTNERAHAVDMLSIIFESGDEQVRENFNIALENAAANEGVDAGDIFTKVEKGDIGGLNHKELSAFSTALFNSEIITGEEGPTSLMEYARMTEFAEESYFGETVRKTVTVKIVSRDEIQAKLQEARGKASDKYYVPPRKAPKGFYYKDCVYMTADSVGNLGELMYRFFHEVGHHNFFKLARQYRKRHGHSSEVFVDSVGELVIREGVAEDFAYKSLMNLADLYRDPVDSKDSGFDLTAVNERWTASRSASEYSEGGDLVAAMRELAEDSGDGVFHSVVLPLLYDVRSGNATLAAATQVIGVLARANGDEGERVVEEAMGPSIAAIEKSFSEARAIELEAAESRRSRLQARADKDRKEAVGTADAAIELVEGRRIEAEQRFSAEQAKADANRLEADRVRQASPEVIGEEQKALDALLRHADATAKEDAHEAIVTAAQDQKDVRTVLRDTDPKDSIITDINLGAIETQQETSEESVFADVEDLETQERRAEETLIAGVNDLGLDGALENEMGRLKKRDTAYLLAKAARELLDVVLSNNGTVGLGTRGRALNRLIDCIGSDLAVELRERGDTDRADVFEFTLGGLKNLQNEFSLEAERIIDVKKALAGGRPEGSSRATMLANRHKVVVKSQEEGLRRFREDLANVDIDGLHVQLTALRRDVETMKGRRHGWSKHTYDEAITVVERELNTLEEGNITSVERLATAVDRASVALFELGHYENSSFVKASQQLGLLSARYENITIDSGEVDFVIAASGADDVIDDVGSHDDFHERNKFREVMEEKYRDQQVEKRAEILREVLESDLSLDDIRRIEREVDEEIETAKEAFETGDNRYAGDLKVKPDGYTVATVKGEKIKMNVFFGNFGDGHTGRTRLNVYARDKYDVLHERREFELWANFALDPKVKIVDDISQITTESLGDAIRVWASQSEENKQLGQRMKKEFHEEAEAFVDERKALGRAKRTPDPFPTRHAGDVRTAAPAKTEKHVVVKREAPSVTEVSRDAIMGLARDISAVLQEEGITAEDFKGYREAMNTDPNHPIVFTGRVNAIDAYDTMVRFFNDNTTAQGTFSSLDETGVEELYDGIARALSEEVNLEPYVGTRITHKDFSLLHRFHKMVKTATPPAEGMTRLYRVTSKSGGNKRWYTDRPQSVNFYLREKPKRKTEAVFYIDVDAETAERCKVANLEKGHVARRTPAKGGSGSPEWEYYMSDDELASCDVKTFVVEGETPSLDPASEIEFLEYCIANIDAYLASMGGGGWLDEIAGMRAQLTREKKTLELGLRIDRAIDAEDTDNAKFAGVVNEIMTDTPIISVVDVNAIGKGNRGVVIGRQDIDGFEQFVLVERGNGDEMQAAKGLVDESMIIEYDPEETDMTAFLESEIGSKIGPESVNARCISVAFAMNEGNRQQVEEIIRNDNKDSAVHYMVVDEKETGKDVVAYNVGNVMTGFIADDRSFMAVGYRREEVSSIADMFGTTQIVGPERIRTDLKSIFKTLMVTGRSA